ncbi:UNVERIFIED_ORG: peroxiredoxin [Peribacillus simplex]
MSSTISMILKVSHKGFIQAGDIDDNKLLPYFANRCFTSKTGVAAAAFF